MRLSSPEKKKKIRLTPFFVILYGNAIWIWNHALCIDIIIINFFFPGTVSPNMYNTVPLSALKIMTRPRIAESPPWHRPKLKLPFEAARSSWHRD